VSTKTESTLVRALDRCEPLSDRLNPIVVKEVRQFLRARSFGWTFVTLVVIVAIIGAIIVLSDEARPSADLGASFSTLLVWMLGIGTLVIVPLQAYQSLGSEWEADTYDQLTLSGLTPGQIMGGKWLSAALQSVLILLAFMPFVALGFLMRGVDLLALGVVLVTVIASSLWASALALAVSSMTRARGTRVVLYVLLGVVTFAGAGSLASFATGILSQPDLITQDAFLGAFTTFVVVGTALAGFCFVYGCGQLAHPEENTSTPLRVLTLVGGIVVLAWLAAASWLGWIPSRGVEALGALTTGALGVLSMLWTAERQRLGRRVAHDLARPGSRTRRCPAVLLPGGSRGAVFSYLLLSLAALYTVFAAGGGSFHMDESRWMGVWILCFYSFFVAMPAALLARFCHREAGAWAVRLVMVLFLAACVVVPAIVGLLLDSRDLTEMRHALNPIWVLIEAADGDLSMSMVVTVIAMGVLGLVVNLPRIFRGTREVLRARAGRFDDDDPAVVRSRERMLQM
jgi:hypothetical protein